MRIHQLLASAAPGDAVTGCALELKRLLAQVGESEIYARYVHPALEGQAHLLPALAPPDESGLSERDVLVYHASIGEPDIHQLLMDRPERLVVYYHNMSPPEPFYPHDSVLAGLLEEGRRELSSLAGRTTMALAVSEYNAAELRGLGYREVRLAPLVIDLARLRDVEGLSEASHRRLARAEGPVVLFVGQLLPHKRPDLLLEMFHVLSTYLLRPATLALVGSPRIPAYSRALEGFAAEANLRQVILTGAVSETELAAWYRRADVFVTASEHEGFCVPLIEAMALERPVVARALAAIPETVGSAGVLLEASASVVEMAEAVHLVLTEPAWRDELVRRGRRRAAELSPQASRAAVLRHLLEVVGG